MNRAGSPASLTVMHVGNWKMLAILTVPYNVRLKASPEGLRRKLRLERSGGVGEVASTVGGTYGTATRFCALQNRD